MYTRAREHEFIYYNFSAILNFIRSLFDIKLKLKEAFFILIACFQTFFFFFFWKIESKILCSEAVLHNLLFSANTHHIRSYYVPAPTFPLSSLPLALGD